MDNAIFIIVLGVVLSQTKINAKAAGWILVILGIIYQALILYFAFA